MITQESVQAFMKDAPNASLVILYSISRVHEKYRATSWFQTELAKRGFSKEDFAEFDANFSSFYEQLINQDDL